MIFNHCNGEPRFIVFLHYWNGDDGHYFDTYEDALVFFRKVQADYEGKPHEAVTISVHDIKKGERKRYLRIEKEA